MNQPEQMNLWPGPPPDDLLQHNDPEIFSDHTEEDQRLNRMYGLVSQPTPIYPAIPQQLPSDYTKIGPIFMAVAGDDTLTPANITAQAAALLLQENVDVELHVFRRGTHGFGMGFAGGPVRHWLTLCEEWMRALQYI